MRKTATLFVLAQGGAPLTLDGYVVDVHRRLRAATSLAELDLIASDVQDRGSTSAVCRGVLALLVAEAVVRAAVVLVRTYRGSGTR